MSLMDSDNPIAKYIVHVGDATSQWLNVVVFFGDNPNESISGRAYRMQDRHPQWKAMRIFVDFLFSWMQDNHCQDAYETDLERARRLLDET